mgnify:CR=1 FL=1
MVDASKCAPSGEHDIIMHISKNLSFEFYDIYDCKTQTQFSISRLIVNNLKIKKEIYLKRIEIYEKHKKALLDRVLAGDGEESMFFDSIEQEGLNKVLADNKFTAKVRIIYKDEEVLLKELKTKSKIDFENAMFFIDELNMVEMIDVRDYEEKINHVKFTNKPKVRDITFGFVAGIAATLLINKVKNRRRKSWICQT